MNTYISHKAFAKILLMALFCLLPTASIFAQGKIGERRQNGSDTDKQKPILLVDNSNQYAQFTMDANGGTKTFSISTNQGTPTTTSLPSWITLVNASPSSLSIKCSPNMTSSQREADFRICAGDLSVRVHAKQPSGKITIKKCEFINTDDYSEKISGPAPRLKASEVQYLNPVLTYDGPGKSQEKTIQVKIYDPHGKLICAKNAPDGFSYRDKVTFFSGKDQTISLLGFGRPNVNIYGVGTVRVEVYMDDELVASGSVELY